MKWVKVKKWRKNAENKLLLGGSNKILYIEVTQGSARCTTGSF